MELACASRVSIIRLDMFEKYYQLLNNQISRREFLKTASAATLSALLASSPRELFALETTLNKPKIDSVILLWIAGGMAQTETFDPKPKASFSKGLDSRKLLSTFDTINSNVDNIKLSAGLESIAEVMDQACVIRSCQPKDLGRILHTRHQYHWHTGYVPPITVAAPHMGSFIAKALGKTSPDVPAFVEIGQSLDGRGSEEVKAFLTAGFLGSEYGPLHIPFPLDAQQKMSVPEGMSLDRFQNRDKLYRDLVGKSPIGELGSDYQRESLLRSMENAYRLLNSPTAKLFDLSTEPKESFVNYDKGRFGLGCLLARRLVEAGTRFVEVSTEYIPFANWDTHNNGYQRTIELKQQVDKPVAQLVKDLNQRGLLDRTLVVIASEFGRVAGRNPGKKDRPTDIIIEREKQYGMHRHFTGASSVVFFGGTAKRGFVYGKTRDEFPCDIVEDPVTIEDLHATIYDMLGIPPDFGYEIEKRPFYVTQDGKGKPVKDLIV